MNEKDNNGKAWGSPLHNPGQHTIVGTIPPPHTFGGQIFSSEPSTLPMPAIFSVPKTLGDIIAKETVVVEQKSGFTKENCQSMALWKIECMLVDANTTYKEMLIHNETSGKQGLALNKIAMLINNLKELKGILADE